MYERKTVRVMFEEINTGEKKRQFFLTYGAFLVNGMLALSIGSLLPYIREAKGIDYVFGGILVSLHSVGNLASSFLAGILAVKIGRKRSILIFESFFSIAYLLLIFGGGRIMLAAAFFMTGLARGAASNFNNTTINNLAPGKAWALNLLHAMFSVGAFLFPLLFTLLTSAHTGYWIYALYFMLATGIMTLLLYAMMPAGEATSAGAGKENEAEGKKGAYLFFREPLFWLCTAILFFYLCAEQGVIGWLVTYFKDSGLLNESLAQIMASMQWLMILAGRLTAAWLSTKVKKENLLIAMGSGFVLFFLLLLFGRSTGMIAAGIMGFGFSMAGIYPTTVSFSGFLIQKYRLAWSYMLTMASLGSIIMPVVIGKIAEQAGIISGMGTVAVVVVIDLILLTGLKIYIGRGKERR